MDEPGPLTPEGTGFPDKNGRRLALASVCAVLFLTFLDTTIVSVALANIQTGLHAGVASLQWVINSYGLVFASLMLAAGLLGDRLGRRRVMIAGVVIFCAGSVVAAVAPSVAVLIAGRSIMGLGAAASEPGTLSVLRHLYPEERRRARALGAWAAVSGLAIALGPVIGGVLVGLDGFRAVFWFNVAAGGAAGISAWRTLPESADPTGARLDVGGLVLGALTLVALTFGLIEGESAGYSSGEVIGLLVVAALAGAAFILVERRSPSPLLELRFFRRPPFSGAVLVAFAASFGLFAIFFFIALYLQIVSGYSGYRIALQFLPMAFAIAVGAVLAGRWVAKSGPGVPMAAGCAAAGAGILLTHVTLDAGSFALIAATLALAGLGVGVAMVPVTSASLGEVPPARSGMAASVANTSRELGAVFAVAILGAIVNSHLTTDLVHRLHALGVPSAFQGIVVFAVEHGAIPNADPAAAAHYGGIVNKVIGAAYGAFRSGVYDALLIAGILLLVLSPLAAALLVRRPAPPPAT